MSAEKPSSIIKYITPDGRLTIEGMKYFTKLIEEVRALEARVAALEAYHP